MINKKPTLLSTLEELVKYLEDDLNAVTPNSIYKKRLSDFQRDLRETYINETRELQNEVTRVLTAAKIKPKYWGRFVNAPITGYEFLNELLELTHDLEKKSRVNHFLNEIKQIKKIRTRRLMDVLTVVLVGVAWLAPIFVTQTTAILKALPVLGLVYTLGVAAYSFYQTHKNKRSFFMEKFIDNFFLLSNSAINIARHAILIAAAVTINPIAAILSVVASSINVLHQFVKLNYMQSKLKEHGSIKESDTLAQKQIKTRLRSKSSKMRRDIIINLAAATVMLGIIAFWSFTPPGLIISVVAVSAIIAVAVLKKLGCRINAKITKKTLMQTFKDIEQAEVKKDLASQNVADHVEALDSTTKMTLELGRSAEKEGDFIELARVTYPPVLTPTPTKGSNQKDAIEPSEIRDRPFSNQKK
ncbi:hypothetical protein [Legionella yabuuchiae]|uniref:hypothetical protein n=1 Tax=Legionella yabuuchiae TaxID=376727 RepID=UPI00105454F0|nr:hypothetical protein [Legionella yabuuchiae]